MLLIRESSFFVVLLSVACDGTKKLTSDFLVQRID